MAEFFARADSYDRFMGRFSLPLGRQFLALVALVAPERGNTALDVGCGPGALTQLLADRLGADQVSAVDPSPPFVEAARSRIPGAAIRVGSAEALPYGDDEFDVTLAQLVIHFMADPIAGVREMARVTRSGGTVAANTWDFGGDRGPLGVYERAARDLDPDAPTERTLQGVSVGDLERIFVAAGLVDVWSGEQTVRVEFASFDEWWEPFTLGVGPAGTYVASLGPEQRARLAAHARELLPGIPFAIDATAWTAIGRVAT
jgi:SAM-dependent methyltransferase